MNWKQAALEQKDALLSELQELIRIESVLDESTATADMPFGPGPRKALDWMLAQGEKAGMKVKDIDHMAGHIEMGDGNELIGVLVHVDVVPASDGWEHPPFEGQIDGGRVFGRGAIDDKGPAMAAWMAMRLVQQSGAKLTRRVRLIVGADEESGFRCMDRYMKTEEMPTMGFAPDADFPIINAEKGIATLAFSMPASAQAGRLLSFSSGERTNMVPDVAEAVVRGAIDAERFRSYLDAESLEGRISAGDDRTTLVVYGRAAHAMEPDKGVNAGLKLLRFLAREDLGGASAEFASFADEAFGAESRGRALGLDFADDISGDTTLNAGVLSFAPESGGKALVSLRYSVSYPFDEKIQAAQQALAGRAALAVEDDSKPHYVEESEELIRVLKEVYERQTGDAARLLSIGGGTYARVLDKGVAFGMLFPGRPDVAHQKDEYVEIDDLVHAVAIYADAIYTLATEEGEGA